MKEEFPRHFLEARVVIFAADSITVYGMPQEKFKILWMAVFWTASICSVCGFVP